MNVFKKALLDSVLEEYRGCEETAGEIRQGSCSLWIDRERRFVCFEMYDHCIQLVFLNREERDAYVQHLRMQGYTVK